MNRNLQAVVFFFLASLSVLSFAIWNRYDWSGKNKSVVGVCASGASLIVVSACVAW
jgi:hypothetical protein